MKSNPLIITPFKISFSNSSLVPVAMKRSQSSSKDQLHEQLQHLEDDWKSYKKSIPLNRHARNIPNRTPSSTSPDLILINLLNNSPKKLLSSLQHSPSSDDDDDDDEGQRLRGRKLLEAFEMCSICSSGLSQCSEVRSSCSCCKHHECSLRSSSFAMEDVAEKKVVTMGSGRWRRVRLLLFVFVCLCSLGLISLIEFDAGEDDHEFIVPT
ncbi:hypothetical protein IHE45_05G167100 [Dioscorea alata]|uniref:Uncharacterized protein n=1 Tax=Dioscorea alata TaxID=55571 RepID=A0ACB7W717_DIOAL|nr:hypothetical protein IHE45_05G167100 [Dioscorea alata]